MASVEYDLNVLGGLMPQIQALIAPPTSDDTSKRGRKLKKSLSGQQSDRTAIEPNSKGSILVRQTKSGKIPNHEYCDSCREGGDLLCCDRCPAAFHLQCHDPPLDEDDVPMGEWACRRCRVSEQLAAEADGEERTSGADACHHNHVSAPFAADWEADSDQKPLSWLLRAAQMINPKQFQLPNELTPSIQLVGTSKRVNPKSAKRQIHETDCGLVSFPVKLCFQCGKSCRRAPLIECDYCPLLFHADCLDPPLTVLPTGRWMCPNHAQHVMEQKLLDSVSLSERIKLWNEFSGHLSQDTVKIDFLKKVHRKNPPFRCKTLISSDNRVIVPNAVKQMYKIRSNLLPNISSANSDCDILTANGDNEMKAEIKSQIKSECPPNTTELDRPTPEEQDEWLSSVIAFQASVAQHLSLRKSVTETRKKSTKDVNTTHSNLLQSKNNISVTSPTKLNEKTIKYNNSHSLNGPLSNLSNDKNVDNEPTVKDNINNQLNGSNSLSTSASLTADDKRSSAQTNSFHSNIDDIANIDINMLDENLVRVLAYQRLQQLLPFNKNDNNLNSIGAQNSNPIPTPHTTVKRICLGDVRARAVLCPVFIRSSSGALNTNSSGPAIAMSYRTLTIGTGADNDVILGNYGFCNYVSSRHACIFYDETSRHYELINYSEHGTTVDNVLYSCDFSDKKVHNPKYTNADSMTVATVKDIIESKKGKKPHENIKKYKNCIQSKSEKNAENVRHGKKRKTLKSGDSDAQNKPNKIVHKKETRDAENVERVSVQVQSQSMPTMSCRSGQTWKPCACKSSCSTLIGGNGAGWEGTALLHHGSYIKIGCNQFVFSITNYGITQNTSNVSSISKTNNIKTESTSNTK